MAQEIQFRDYLFTNEGISQYGAQATFEADQDGLSRIVRTAYSVKQNFTEGSNADNEARHRRLRDALLQAEGVLKITDENGTVILEEVVKVKSSNVPEEWREFHSEVTVVFEGRKLLSANAIAASFTPTGDVLAIPLENILGWKESIRTERYAKRRSDRKETTVSISASGFVLADKTKTLAERLAYLQSILQRMRQTQSKDGLLVYGAESRLVQVASLDGDVADGSDRLQWSLEAFYEFFLPTRCRLNTKFQIVKTRSPESF